MMINQLPPSELVDVSRLAQLFRNCTQSYKFLFFRSILDAVEAGTSEPSNEDLLVGMLIGAWWPVALAKLNIGNARGTDKLGKLVSEIGDVTKAQLERKQAVQKARDHFRREKDGGALRYVKKHLLSPWYQSENAIYSIHRDGIVISPAWMRYLTVNLGVVRGWSDHAWLNWVQSRNANVPVTMAKLLPPGTRRALTRERKFFMRGLERRCLQCIYTDQPLSAPIHLDHFLPRSFVGHDRIWNLLPTSSHANTKKGMSIPNLQYVAGLRNLHAVIVPLAVAAQEDPELTEQYCQDLRLTPHELMNSASIASAFDAVVPGMMQIAERMGFPAGWTFQHAIAATTIVDH